MTTHTDRLLHVHGVAIAILLVTGGVACSSSKPDASGSSTGSGGTHGGSNNGAAGAKQGGSSGMSASAGSSGSNASSGSGGAHASGGGGGSSSSGSGGAHAGSGGAKGTSGSGGTSASGSGGSGSSSAGDSGTPSYDDVKSWIDDYAAAHPGSAGDVVAKTPAEIAADPDAQRLLSLCGENQRPVIPKLAWEYGGSDHAWINPDASALVYCVYIPVSPSSTNWQYDSGADHVTADVYVLFPDQNPCKAEQGADQVVKCIGDMTNFEILVDTASLNDGADAGLSLSNASTELMLILGDNSKVSLYSAS